MQNSRCLILLIFGLALSACTTISNPYLFEAKKKDKRIVIFGTMHVGVPEWEVPGSVHKELRNSTLAFFEIDAELAQIDRKLEPKDLVILPGETPLDERLTPAEFKALADALPEISRENLRHLRPLVAVVLLAKDRQVEVRPYDASALDIKNSMDLALIDEAHDRKIPTVSLDRDVLDRCRSGLEGAHLAMLKQLLHGKTFEEHVAEIQRYANAYRRSDDAYLQSHSEIDSQTSAKCILEDRNRAWAFALDRSVVAGDRAFVAVGVGHLIFKNQPTLLDLLSEKGFEIRRMTE